jgi:hypothetical protein
MLCRVGQAGELLPGSCTAGGVSHLFWCAGHSSRKVGELAGINGAVLLQSAHHLGREILCSICTLCGLTIMILPYKPANRICVISVTCCMYLSLWFL